MSKKPVSEFVDIKYVKYHDIEITKLRRYPNGVSFPKRDFFGNILPADQQTIAVTRKEAHSLVECQKLFEYVKKTKAENAEIKEE